MGWVVFPSFSNARPSSLLPAPCAPGCGNPIANLAHVIRRPVRLLSALPCLALLRTLVESGISWPRLASCPRVSLTRPRICAANAIAQLLPSPRPTRHPLPSPASQLRLPRADGIRRLWSTGLWLDRGGEWTQTVGLLSLFLLDPSTQTAGCFLRADPLCRGRILLTSRDITLFRPRDVTAGGLRGEVRGTKLRPFMRPGRSDG